MTTKHVPRVTDLRALPLMTIARDRLLRKSDWILYCGAVYPRADELQDGRKAG